ncbi:MAG: SMP-30/Gluconolaconase/LRE domain protein [Mucilaginibacter sp.]|nr:SMP-30/Gluconolaconase/LRE domain protein [Mucilaginibacter sp.]
MKIKNTIKVFPVIAIGLLLAACSKKTTTHPTSPISLKTSYTLNSVGLYPESIDYDNKNHRFIVGSFNKGTVSTLNTNGDLSSFISDNKLVTVTGVYADSPRNRLIVLSGDIGSSEKSAPNGKSGGSVAYAGIYNLTTGTLIKGIDLKSLTPNAGALPNDATVDQAGNIYVTDSFSPLIYKIDAGYTASVFVTDSRFSAPAGSFGLNGIVVDPDGYLLVTKTDNGKLFKISLTNPKSFTEVSGFSSASPDALEWNSNRDLVVVENGLGAGKVYTLTSKDNWGSTTKLAELTIGKEAFPTSATLVEQKDIYVLATTKLGLFLGGDKTQTNFIIQKLVQ